MTDTAEHLERLRTLADYTSDANSPAVDAALRWAIDTLSRLTITGALKLARDEGRRVRCKGWATGVYLIYDTGWLGKGFYKRIPCRDGVHRAVQLYAVTIDDATSEWEVL